jgi:hypothetical protein
MQNPGFPQGFHMPTRNQQQQHNHHHHHHHQFPYPIVPPSYWNSSAYHATTSSIPYVFPQRILPIHPMPIFSLSSSGSRMAEGRKKTMPKQSKSAGVTSTPKK